MQTGNSPSCRLCGCAAGLAPVSANLRLGRAVPVQALLPLSICSQLLAHKTQLVPRLIVCLCAVPLSARLASRL